MKKTETDSLQIQWHRPLTKQCGHQQSFLPERDARVKETVEFQRAELHRQAAGTTGGELDEPIDPSWSGAGGEEVGGLPGAAAFFCCKPF